MYIKHDPNYDDGDDEDVENGMQVDEDTDVAKEEGSEDGEEEYVFILSIHLLFLIPIPYFFYNVPLKK